MADIADKASDAEDAILALRIANRPTTQLPKGTGACLYCGGPLHDGRRWCDADCRDDHQRKTQNTLGR
jgi:hypothetical protein